MISKAMQEGVAVGSEPNTKTRLTSKHNVNGSE